MKLKLKFFVVAAAGLILIAGCSRIERTEPGGLESIRMKVSLPAAKTTLGQLSDGRYPTLWCEGDRLSLNGILSNALDASEAGSNKATFGFLGDLKAPFNLLYPGTKETETVEFIAEQTYVASSFDPAAAPMWSSGMSYENAVMKHLSSLVCFSLTSEKGVNIKQIQVTSIGGEPLSGTFRMEKDASGLFTGAIQSVKGASSTSVMMDQAVQLGTLPTPFYVAIPAGTYSEGFSALVITDDDKAMSLSFYTKDGSKVIEPSRVIRFETAEFESEASVVLIKNETDLLSLGESSMAGVKAILVNNIDLEGSNWTPIPTFYADFNGAGHVISGISQPLCDDLQGSISNLTIVADIKVTKGWNCAAFANTMADGATLKACKSKGRIEMATTDVSSSTDLRLGGIVGQYNGGTLENVVNEAEVTLSQCNCQNAFIGGVLGQASVITFNGIHNKGTVNVDGSITSKALFAGGVAGQCKGSSFFGNTASNSAESQLDVKLSSSMTNLYIGGLIGYIYQKGIVVDSLTNRGQVFVEFPSGCSLSDFRLGGITGYLYSTSACTLKMQNAVNEGNITVKGSPLTNTTDLTKGIQIGGILGRTQVTGSSDCHIEISGCRNSGNISLIENDGGAYIYQAGILGCCSVLDLKVSKCVNTGNLSMEGTSSLYIAGGIIANPFRNGVTDITVSECSNTGTITYTETTPVKDHITAGGIIGNISAQSGKEATVHISDCTNDGDVLRFDQTKTLTKKYSIAGGILGATGRYITGTDIYLDVTIENCTNNGEITFNQFTGTEEFSEASTDYSFSGGILGLGKAGADHAVTVRSCINNGDILATSGQHGGIVGLMYSGTAITGTSDSYCINNGRVCDRSMDQKGSGNCIAGGIAGYLRNVSSPIPPNTIEFAWNAGKVCGSTTSSTCAGGIVGKLVENQRVSRCKNSGDVRNCSIKAADLKYGGAISGTVGTSNMVSKCGVGGRVMRPAGWITMTDTEYRPYIYNNTPSPTEAAYTECCYWDGISKLPWEGVE